MPRTRDKTGWPEWKARAQGLAAQRLLSPIPYGRLWDCFVRGDTPEQAVVRHARRQMENMSLEDMRRHQRELNLAAEQASVLAHETGGMTP